MHKAVLELVGFRGSQRWKKLATLIGEDVLKTLSNAHKSNDAKPEKEKNTQKDAILLMFSAMVSAARDKMPKETREGPYDPGKEL